jgi:hypothetical protein
VRPCTLPSCHAPYVSMPRVARCQVLLLRLGASRNGSVSVFRKGHCSKTTASVPRHLAAPLGRAQLSSMDAGRSRPPPLLLPRASSPALRRGGDTVTPTSTPPQTPPAARRTPADLITCAVCLSPVRAGSSSGRRVPLAPPEAVGRACRCLTLRDALVRCSAPTGSSSRRRAPFVTCCNHTCVAVRPLGRAVPRSCARDSPFTAQ